MVAFACAAPGRARLCATPDEQRVLDALATPAAYDWTTAEARTVAPHADIRFDEERGVFRFGVALAHVGANAHYTVGFEAVDGTAARWVRGDDAMHRPGTCQSDAGVLAADESRSPADFWWRSAAAANAENAADYVVARDGVWRYRAASCAHFKLSATLSAAELLQCRQSARGERSVHVARVANTTILSVTGRLWVSLATLASADAKVPAVTTWSFPFVFYVDEYETKVLLSSSSVGVPNAPDGGAHLRNMETVAAHHGESRLRLVVDVRSEAPDERAYAALLVDGDALSCTHGATDGAEPLRCHSELRCVPHGNGTAECAQQWDLTTRRAESAAAHEERHLLRFYASETEADAAALPDLIVHVDVAVPTGTHDERQWRDALGELRAHVSLHGADAAEQRQKETVYEGGERACLQSYVVAPQSVLESVDVDMLDAWLCLDERSDEEVKADVSVHRHCDTQRRWTRLLADGAEPSDDVTPPHVRRHYNASVHDPGSFGVWASTLCFAVDARFMDGGGESVLRQRQVFQARIGVRPVPPRRSVNTSVAVVDAARAFHAPLSAAIGDGGDADAQRRTEHAHARAAFHHRALSAWTFNSDTLRQPSEHGTAVLTVSAANAHDLHNVSSSDASLAIGAFVGTLVCVGASALFAVWWAMRGPAVVAVRAM